MSVLFVVKFKQVNTVVPLSVHAQKRGGEVEVCGEENLLALCVDLAFYGVLCDHFKIQWSL